MDDAVPNNHPVLHRLEPEAKRYFGRGLKLDGAIKVSGDTPDPDRKLIHPHPLEAMIGIQQIRTELRILNSTFEPNILHVTDVHGFGYWVDARDRPRAMKSARAQRDHKVVKG